jgi:hypothetical protein
MRLNSCVCSCISIVENYNAYADNFITWFSSDVEGGCDVVGYDLVVCVVLLVCSYSPILNGAIIFVSKSCRSVAICICTSKCISAYFFIAHRKSSSMTSLT